MPKDSGQVPEDLIERARKFALHPLKPHYSPLEVAHMLQRSRRTVYGWMRTSHTPRLASYKAGPQNRRITLAALLDFLEAVQLARVQPAGQTPGQAAKLSLCSDGRHEGCHDGINEEICEGRR